MSEFQVPGEGEPSALCVCHSPYLCLPPGGGTGCFACVFVHGCTVCREVLEISDRDRPRSVNRHRKVIQGEGHG